MIKTSTTIEKKELYIYGLEPFYNSLNNSFTDVFFNETFVNLESQISAIKNNSSNDYLGYNWETLFLEKELESFSKMRIVHIYNKFEFGLIFLINTSYNINFTIKPRTYEWAFEFLISKNIEIEKIKGFSEIKELTNVIHFINNNSFFDTNNIPVEFESKDEIKHKDLFNFFNRIESQVEQFLKILADLIFDDLFVFNEKRILRMVDYYTLKFEQKDLELFTRKLHEKL